jgi:hypothetical protein
MIYFAQSLPHGPIKIGYSKEPARRIADLAATQANGMYILATMSGEVADERALHELLKEHRLNGEWFEPHDDVWLMVDMARSSEAVTTHMERFEKFTRDTFTTIFNAAFPRSRDAAEAAGVSPRTAEFWAKGKRLPFMPSMLSLCRANPMMKWWFLALGAALDIASRENREIEEVFRTLKPEHVDAFWKDKRQ